VLCAKFGNLTHIVTIAATNSCVARKDATKNSTKLLCGAGMKFIPYAFSSIFFPQNNKFHLWVLEKSMDLSMLYHTDTVSWSEM
jgi:hypothetical protein